MREDQRPTCGIPCDADVIASKDILCLCQDHGVSSGWAGARARICPRSDRKRSGTRCLWRARWAYYTRFALPAWGIVTT